MVHTTQQNNKASKNRSDEGENDNTEVMKEAQGTMKKTPSSNEVNGGSSSVDNRVDVENQQTPEGEVHGVQEAQDFVGSLPYIDSSRSALSSNATSFNRESTRTSLLTNNQRVSLKMDLETGQKGGSRAQRAMVSIYIYCVEL